MRILSILLLIFVHKVESITCPTGQLQCGLSQCYDPTIQGCTNSTGVLQCINSCNGTCYSSSQYCYNNTKVCNNGQSVCDVRLTAIYSFPYGLTCYNPTQFMCSDNILCYPYTSCGNRCLNDSNSVCATDNQTICFGFYFWNYYYTNRYLNLCGPQKQCYDNTTSVCLNRTTVCSGLNARLCGTNCYNPDTQTCVNGSVRCISSCNGTCYSSSQYCYNNTKICTNGESVCDVRDNPIDWFPYGLTCYNATQLTCSNNILCSSRARCGNRCLNGSTSVCAPDNQTICYGFDWWTYYYTNRYLNLCGPQKQCFDNTTSVCLNRSIVCSGLNARLCSTNCYNPDAQTCVNRTVRCINSCNGTCYSSSQYCYNNSKVCTNGESVCDVRANPFGWFSYGLTCFNASQFTCSDNILCSPYTTCRNRCLNSSNSVCATDNETICHGYYFWSYYNTNRFVNVCGPQKQCYDNATSVCLNRTTVCSGLNARLCGASCYNPDTQTCVNGSVGCINSCNGTCYSNAQYCYNNSKVCNNGESICDVRLTPIHWFPNGLTCYNASQFICSDNILCYPYTSCGNRCLNDSNSACASDNQTICFGFYWWTHYYYNKYPTLCGPQKQCYDNATSVCLNRSIVCSGLNARLCGASCYNPDTQTCVNGSARCINSCNGTCYSNTRFCYNNTKICSNGESVCDVRVNPIQWFASGLTCYNASQFICADSILCSSYASCGNRCLNDSNSVCATDNQTVCYGFYFWSYYNTNRFVNVCGPQKQCYDNATSVCLNRSIVCTGLNARLCSTTCYNPDLQSCVNGSVRCIKSCNGTCYSSSQYCYNNTKICNNRESVCDVRVNTIDWFPYGLTCYNPSQLMCSNNILCYPYASCGDRCLNSSNSVCAFDNQTICYGFDWWTYYYNNRKLNLCGAQKRCYDNTTSVCLNRSIVCSGLNARLCGTNCYNPDTQTCVNGSVRCMNSCNGTCYSNTQFCYNNTRVCNNGESVCDVRLNPIQWFASGLTCYNASQFICSDNILCSPYASCGNRCLNDSYSVCATDNETVCYGFYFWSYYYSNGFVNVCGPQKQCYDNTISICTGNNDTLCPVGSQLCSGVCYNPQLQYCIGGNNTVFCLSNPSSVNCVLNTTMTASTTSMITSTATLTSATTRTRTTTITSTTTVGPGSCCSIKNCTSNSDCCQSNVFECQCFRHLQTDVYGSCVNPSITPICGDSCPVQGKCRTDADCCACQCATITFIDAEGNSVTTKQCARR